jgi:hypothetical protein
MPYREKLAWLSLAGMAVCYGPYFALTYRSPLLEQPLPNLRLMALFAAAAGGNAVWVLLGRLFVRMTTPRDERGVMPFTSAGWHIVNSMVASVVIAESLRYAMIVVGYRRGLR